MAINLKRSEVTRLALSVLELLFLMLTGVYLLWQVSLTTTFFLPFPGWFDGILLKAMTLVACLRLFFYGPYRIRSWLALGIAAVYIAAFFFVDYRFLRYLAVLTIGLRGIRYRRILNTFLATVGAFVCVTMVAGITGTIVNFVHIKQWRLRSSWGFCYPTDFASIVLYALMILWVARKRMSDWTMLLLGCGSAALSRFIANSSTSFLCSLLFIAMILYHIFERSVVDRRPGLKWIRRAGGFAMMAVFPLCALAMFALMYAYRGGAGFTAAVNDMMSQRLKLAVEAWQLHGLKPFGTPFDQVGNGFSMFGQTGYNFVDSSYALILIRYGWVTLGMLCLLWVWTTKRALDADDRRMALVMALIAVHSFSEHHFTECNYNILLVMPLAAYSRRARAAEPLGKPSSRRWAALVTAAACAGLVLAAPALLSWLKTVLEAKGLTGGGDVSLIDIPVIFALLFTIGLALWAIHRLALNLFSRAPGRASALPALALILCLGAAGGMVAGARTVVGEAVRSSEPTIRQEREALEIVSRSATGKVYAGTLPAVYASQFPAFSYSPFSGEELARTRGTTVLMNADTEYASFFRFGGMYATISSAHGLYTGDPAVIRALREAGYYVRGIFDTVRSVDLAALASENGLEYAEGTGVCLNGPGASLDAGPRLDLHEGKYNVTYVLQLPEGAPRDDEPLCTLRVCSFYGQFTLAERLLYRRDFDEDGTLSVAMPFSMDSSRGVEFLARAEEGQSFTVREISFYHMDW